MIAVHELAHIRHKAHDKSFYQPCRHMLPDYHRIELDVRHYRTQLEAVGPLDWTASQRTSSSPLTGRRLVRTLKCASTAEPTPHPPDGAHVKKPLFLTSLALISGAVFAEWQFVGSNARADYYIEAESIRKDGGKRQVLEMLNLKAADSQGNRSYLALYEYECPSARSRILRTACFDGPMGRGNMTAECQTPGDWSAPGAESAALVKLRLVCGH